MSRSPGAVVEAHLRRLDGEALAAFVADLWAARGFEVRHDGRRVEATGRAESVGIIVAGRFGSVSDPGDGPVDVVVAPRGSRRARRFADRADARLVDAAALREMLWYGVDERRRVALCERHLGEPPATLRAPVTARAGDKALAVVTRVARNPAVTAVTLLVVVGAVFGTAFLAQSPGGSDDGEFEIPGSNASDDTVDDSNSSPVPATDAGSGLWTVEDARFVPGLSADGIDDLEALARAHEDALRNRSYTLWLDTYWPHEGDPNASVVQRDTDIPVDGDRYVITVELERNDHRSTVAELYYDGVDWWTREANDSVRSYGPLENPVPLAPAFPFPFDFRDTAVTRYLATPETNVTDVVRRDGRTLYRVRGRGTPSGADHLEDYEFLAYVTPEGMVHSATVEATVLGENGPYHARFQWTYGRFDRTVVIEPSWADTP